MKALSPLNLSLGFVALSGGGGTLAIAALADRAGPRRVGMYSHGADKAEPDEGRRLPGRGRRGPGLRRRSLQIPGQAYFSPCQRGLITADFPDGDGKEKIIFQSRLTAFFFFNCTTFGAYYLSNCTSWKPLNR